MAATEFYLAFLPDDPIDFNYQVSCLSSDDSQKGLKDISKRFHVKEACQHWRRKYFNHVKTA
jgi:hypothetical protein